MGKKKQEKELKVSIDHSSVGSLQMLPSYSSISKTLAHGFVEPYDENLLERSFIQWQFGDWDSLQQQLTLNAVQYHPERAKLIMLSAASHLQTGHIAQAKHFLRLAQDWGCNDIFIRRIMVAGVYNSLGRSAATAGMHESALAHFEKAVEIASPCSDTRLLAKARITYQLSQLGFGAQTDIGLVLQSISKNENQVAHSNKALSSPSVRAEYLNKNGELLYKEGNFKLALEYFQRAYDLAPHNAWYCQNIAEAAARLNFKKGDQWECEQLGNTMDETGKWDVAVRHYRRALQLDRAEVERHHKSQVFKLETAHEGLIDNPIFIVGCGHSGTSLLLAILGAHPRINPIPNESALFLRSDPDINKIMREWDIETKSNGKFRWAEKTPPHIFQIHRFLAFRPKSQFIIILRDGRDVVCSLKPRIGYAEFGDRLDRWIYDNMAGFSYWKHSQVKVVKYEDLVAHTEATLRSICQFIGEEYSEELLNYHKTEHRWYSKDIIKPEAINNHEDHKNNRNWQINQPIFDGRGRWKNEMTEAEKEAFKNSFAQKLLEEFGYCDNKNW